MPRSPGPSHAWGASLLTAGALLLGASRAAAAPVAHAEVELRYERQGGSEAREELIDAAQRERRERP